MRVTLTRSQFMKFQYSFSIEVVSFLNGETNRILKSRRLMTVSEKRSYQNMPFLPNEKMYIILWLHTKSNVLKACMDSLANTVWTMKVRQRLTDLQNVVWLINSDVMSWQHGINVSMKP